MEDIDDIIKDELEYEIHKVMQSYQNGIIRKRAEKKLKIKLQEKKINELLFFTAKPTPWQKAKCWIWQIFGYKRYYMLLDYETFYKAYNKASIFWLRFPFVCLLLCCAGCLVGWHYLVYQNVYICGFIFGLCLSTLLGIVIFIAYERVSRFMFAYSVCSILVNLCWLSLFSFPEEGKQILLFILMALISFIAVFVLFLLVYSLFMGRITKYKNISLS